jgi:hypothetical protein
VHQILGAGNGIRTRDIQLGRLTLYHLSYSRLGSLFHGGGWIRTNEGESRQIYSLLPLATWVPLRTLSFVCLSSLEFGSRNLFFHSSGGRRGDSNPGPTDYKSVALPTELHRQTPYLQQVGLDDDAGTKSRTTTALTAKHPNFSTLTERAVQPGVARTTARWRRPSTPGPRASLPPVGLLGLGTPKPEGSRLYPTRRGTSAWRAAHGAWLGPLSTHLIEEQRGGHRSVEGH